MQKTPKRPNQVINGTAILKCTRDIRINPKKNNFLTIE